MKNSTAKPEAVKPVGPKGRFVGLVGVGKERYQVHLIETVGQTVVRREVLYAGRKDVINGVEVQGDTLAAALSNLNAAMGKHLRDNVSDLWRP